MTWSALGHLGFPASVEEVEFSSLPSLLMMVLQDPGRSQCCGLPTGILSAVPVASGCILVACYK